MTCNQEDRRYTQIKFPSVTQQLLRVFLCLDMLKIIVRDFLTNHVTFESARKNYYLTSYLINMKVNETVLKQTHKFVNENF